MIAQLKENYVEKYCDEKKYTFKKTSKDGHLRIDVSNTREQINLTLYDSGALVVGGPKSALKGEFETLKKKMVESPEILDGLEKLKVKSCASKYVILLPDVRQKIKDELANLVEHIEYINDPTPSEEYRAKLTKDKHAISLTQYKNGTLFLQGKSDMLYEATCDMVEKVAVPSEKDVISRFFSDDEVSLQKFTSVYSPQLLEEAEKQLKSNLGDDIFNFLNAHDKKWLIAAECLRLANIPLPEYSPLVMPASKAFEGFVKKLLISVGFYPANHFDSKTASFGYLNDTNNPVRIAFVAKEKYADTHLKKINVSLDTNRNFMMHSDGAIITKLETYDEAVAKLTSIYDDIKEIYKYFKVNAVFGL